jgi:adenylosuccinate lyase
MMEKLTIYPERMQANLDALGGVVHSQKVLLALTQAGMSREDAYAAVQRAAMATWQALGSPGARDFRANLLADAAVAQHLSPAALDAAMDPARDFAHVDTIFARVFGAS